MYYPFGSLQPGRHSSTSLTSRYGFNGMEKDNELKGEGNSLDFGARMYDSRIGKWKSVDAFERNYPYQGTYNFSKNNPVWSKDPDGNIVTIVVKGIWNAKAFIQMTSTIRGADYAREAISSNKSDNKRIHNEWID